MPGTFRYPFGDPETTGYFGGYPTAPSDPHIAQGFSDFTNGLWSSQQR